MAKNIRRMFAMALVMCMIVSALPVQALAAEGETFEQDGLTVTITPSEGSTSDVVVSGTSESANAAVSMEGTKEVTTNTTENSDGGSTTNITTKIELAGTVKEDGTTKNVTWEQTHVDSSTVSADGMETKSHWKEQGKETATYEQTTNVPDVKVDLIEDGEEVDNPSGSAAITPETPESKDPKEGEDDTVYDETEITGTTDREVTAEVVVGATEEHKNITDAEGNVLETYDPETNTGLDPIASQWDESKQDVKQSVAGMTEEELAALFAAGKLPVSPLTKEQIDEALKNKPEGYDYLYIGLGEDSYYGVGWNYTSEDYYNGWGTGTHQFALGDFSEKNLDAETLKLIATYCADLETSSRKGYWYTVENLEDAGYYNEESANHIRAIAANAYWGTVGTNEDGTPVTGSLAAVKEMMSNAKDSNGNPVFTQDQIDNLTEGEALAASQMAIWKYGNPYQAEDKDIYLDASTLDYNTYQGHSDWHYSTSLLKEKFKEQIIAENNLDVDTMDEAALEELNQQVNARVAAAKSRIDALADHLMSLTQTAEEAETTQVINEKNFIEDMSMTVGEMVKEDADGNGNNSYNVDFTFSLVVTPGDKDDMIVKVINSNGEVVGTGRIAGDSTQDSGFNSVIYNESDNSYTLKDMELVEGSNTKFNLKLEGAQYLEEGVYIYTSEVRNDVPSQTFVGMAEGYKSVDVAMEVDLTFHVKEGTVTTVREWADEGDPVVTPPAPPEPPTREPRTWNPPQVNRLANNDVVINEEPVPLASPAITGDSTGLWVALFLTVAFAMVAINVFDKKRSHETF